MAKRGYRTLDPKKDYDVGFDHDGNGWSTVISGREIMETIESMMKKEGWKGEELTIRIREIEG